MIPLYSEPKVNLMATQRSTLPSTIPASVGRLLYPEGRTLPLARRLLVLVFSVIAEFGRIAWLATPDRLAG